MDYKLAGIVLGFLFAFSCANSNKEETMIRITGSSTVLPIASQAAELYRQRHPELTITVNAGGSGVGLSSVGQGLAEIGMMSRELSPEEKTNYPDVHFKEWIIGHDAVACVVSSEIHKAGVTTLTKQEIRHIYMGDIQNWKELGGPNREIVCIDKETHRGTRQVFIGYIFGDKRAQAPGADIVSGSNNEEQTKLSLSNAAIGMLSFAWRNDKVRGIAIQDSGAAIAPTIENVKNGSYPIIRVLRFITRESPHPITSNFIQFVQGPTGQSIVEESGFVPL